MQEKLRSRFDEAVALARCGRKEESVAILNELILQDPESPAVQLTLGDVFQSMGRMDLAIEAFRAAVGLRPKHERVSISLFHCLLEAGRQKEALDEAYRYLAISDSQEYREMLKSLTDKG